MKYDNVIIRASIAGTLGAVLFALGSTLAGIFPDIVKNIMREKMRLVNGTEVYESWIHVELPINLRIYVFNITNHEDVLNGSKPILQQLGPYTFNKFRKKVNITTNYSEDTLTYSQRNWFVFLPNLSNGSLTDKVTSLNVPLAIVAFKTEGKLNILERMVLPNIIKNENATAFVTKTVEELLFKGYQDKLLVTLGKLGKKEYLLNGMFGYFYGQNNTVHGTYTVFSGIKNPDQMMEIYMKDNSTTLNWWHSKYCNMINGSDGSKFKMFLSREDTIYIYVHDFCRSVYLTYEKDEIIHHIQTYRFRVPYSALAPADIEPNNKCFCSKELGCLKKGGFYAGHCQKGSPIVVSYPHFYLADDSYYESVIGLNRNKELHESFLDIEPTTGFVVRGIKRGQANLALKPFSHIKEFKNMPNMLLPLIWTDESIEWTSEFAKSYSNKVFKPQRIGTACIHTLIAVGALILIPCIVIITIKIISRNKEKTII